MTAWSGRRWWPRAFISAPRFDGRVRRTRRGVDVHAVVAPREVRGSTAADDDQQPTPLASKRLLSPWHVCRAGHSPLGTRPVGATAELPLKSRARLPAGPTRVRFQSGNSRDLPLKAGHRRHLLARLKQAYLQGHSAHAPGPTIWLPCRRSRVRIPSAASKRPALQAFFVRTVGWCVCVNQTMIRQSLPVVDVGTGQKLRPCRRFLAISTQDLLRPRRGLRARPTGSMLGRHRHRSALLVDGSAIVVQPRHAAGSAPGARFVYGSECGQRPVRRSSFETGAITPPPQRLSVP